MPTTARPFCHVPMNANLNRTGTSTEVGIASLHHCSPKKRKSTSMATAYIETTIPSYYVARTSDSLLQAAKQAATRRWWDQGCSDFDLFTSLETLDEASKGDSLKAADRLEMLKDIPLLPLPDEGLNLAQQLVESGIVPPKAASDALHIAVASVHRIDYLVTWSFKHIANPFIRDRLRLAVASAGFDLPVMCSPDELLQNEDEDI